MSDPTRDPLDPDARRLVEWYAFIMCSGWQEECYAMARAILSADVELSHEAALAGEAANLPWPGDLAADAHAYHVFTMLDLYRRAIVESLGLTEKGDRNA